jgi:hypothetical protein
MRFIAPISLSAPIQLLIVSNSPMRSSLVKRSTFPIIATVNRSVCEASRAFEKLLPITVRAPEGKKPHVAIGVGTHDQGQEGYFDQVAISHSSGGGYSGSFDFDVAPTVPMSSPWGVALMASVLLMAGSFALRDHRLSSLKLGEAKRPAARVPFRLNGWIAPPRSFVNANRACGALSPRASSS